MQRLVITIWRGSLVMTLEVHASGQTCKCFTSDVSFRPLEQSVYVRRAACRVTCSLGSIDAESAGNRPRITPTLMQLCLQAQLTHPGANVA